MAKAPTKATTKKKAAPKAKSPLEKAVAAHLTSGKTLDRARTKHAATGDALKKLQEGK